MSLVYISSAVILTVIVIYKLERLLNTPISKDLLESEDMEDSP